MGISVKMEPFDEVRLTRRGTAIYTTLLRDGVPVLELADSDGTWNAKLVERLCLKDMLPQRSTPA